MAYSLTFNVRKLDSDGRHNDRNFDLEKAPHIDKDKSDHNRYWNYQNDKEKSFLEIEKDFYRENFSKTIELQNERNNKARHQERNKSLDDYYKDRLTRPEDVLIQIGDKDKHIREKELWKVAEKYKEELERKYGDNCKVLTMALHIDEKTPHVHMRRVWVHEHDGIKEVSKNAALEKDIQFSRNNEETSKTRYNNPSIAFTRMERDMVKDICKEQGIELTKENKSRGYDLTKDQARERDRELAEREERLAELEKEIEAKKKELERLKQREEKEISLNKVD